jgi:formylglycine-generating enzyme required for sulfatase activity
LLEAVSQFFELETSDNTLASPTEPELIQVPAGNFLMGSNPKKDKSARSDEQPQHKVYLSEYQISKYPITNVEYQAFVFDMEQRYKSTREFEKYIPGNWDGTWYPKGFDDHPVVNITWMNANEYCSWLSEWTGKPYRLPTEAEWEKAARGKSGRIFPWGNRWYSNRCNSRENGINGTTPVGQYSPKGDSPFGIVDMVGNVSEWCLDWYDMKTYGQRTNDEVIDPHGGSQGAYKVLRGGAFSDGKDLTRCAFRGWNRPGYWGWFYGFRVVVPSAK